MALTIYNLFSADEGLEAGNLGQNVRRSVSVVSECLTKHEAPKDWSLVYHIDACRLVASVPPLP